MIPKPYDVDRLLNTIRVPRVAAPFIPPAHRCPRDSHCLGAELVPERPQATASSRGTRSAPSGRAMTRILVVDDDAAVRSVVSEALVQDGYQVDAAGNFRQALAAFREHRPDALVLDLEMPIMDGPTLMRTLRERTKWGRVPLVVVSGTDGATDAAPRLGARACLHKPFELSELLHTLEQVAPPNN